VRGECLRSPHLVTDSVLVPDRVADLLLDREVAQDAAATVWRLSDTGLQMVLNIVLSRGLVASGFTPEQTRSALTLLRRTCPPDRLAALEAGPTPERQDTSLDVFGTASRLVELCAAADPDAAEIRRIGHRLDEAGGIALMREVAACAGDLSARRMAERDLNRWWDRIGHWMA
jgi:hypothetical protein